jgi:hypothetical protein
LSLPGRKSVDIFDEHRLAGGRGRGEGDGVPLRVKRADALAIEVWVT